MAEALADGPREVAVAGPDADERARDLHRVALAGVAPGMVISAGEPDAVGIPLLAGRPLVGGQPAAYVCRRFVCQAPVTTPQALAAQVGATLQPFRPVPGPGRPRDGLDGGLSLERTDGPTPGVIDASE